MHQNLASQGLAMLLVWLEFQFIIHILDTAKLELCKIQDKVINFQKENLNF